MKAPADIAIRRAAADDVTTVVDVLATALRNTEVAHWLVPDRTERHQVYRDYFALVTPWFLDHGIVHLADGGAGAAMWAMCTGRFEPDIADYDARLAAACGAATNRFIGLDAAMLVQHPDTTHAYLAFLGVSPDAQGTGVGSALLAHQHRQLDIDGMPAYLEATGLRNAALYRHNGYSPQQLYSIGIGGPALCAMWREPK